MVETERGRCDAKRNTHHPERKLFLAINRTIWRCGFIAKETTGIPHPGRFVARKIMKASGILIKLLYLLLNATFNDLIPIN